ncbi:hypothetical protein [Streptomyces sp. MNP-20]|uniref:hypothetical protein n=1 Tax=Streptomyces sp. MNP-20 TaxID=2721165 RepID=UPI001554E801|nr:hypothetical protein [Streptomyces sp. MNP-20]
MRTPAELREALSARGFPGDRQASEEEPGAADLDDLAQVREITQAYRHPSCSATTPRPWPRSPAPTDDVTAEPRRKLAEAGR